MFHLGKHIPQGVPTRSGSTGSTPRSTPAMFAHRPSEETCHGQRVNYRCEPLPAGALDGHLGGRHGRGADGRAGDRHRRVEHLRAGTGQRRHPGPRLADGDRRRDQLRHRGPRRRDHRPDPPDSSPMDTTSGLCTPAPENLDVTTVTEPQRCRRHCAHRAPTPRAGSAPGPTAPDLLDLVPHGFRQTRRGYRSRRTSRPHRRRARPRPPRRRHPTGPHLIDAVVGSPPR